ncbi:receptor-like serine/threonine-protein kinase SD1-8 [Zingiber officinale]|uniref:receptor-like serine/threonine-protein kinase SD1-8 n=1 Tax=Zingiber officinale TaxID=94328 RepID=UPI001C4D24C9|nr:receptor-like serine/threonine-protein kinase SD1-8 [Zingiber officinale]
MRRGLSHDVDSCSSSAALLLLLLLLLATLFSISGGADTLTPDLPLLVDGSTTLTSAGGTFQLGFFNPSGSTNRYVGIWYNRISPQTVVWIANRRSPITTRFGNLSLTTTGALVLTDGNSSILWTSGAPDSSLSNPVAQLFDDGNFAVHESGSGGSDGFAWQSFDFPTDTQLPGMILGRRRLRNGTDLDINITASTSDSDPTPGPFVYGLDLRGDPQLFIWSGTEQYWRAGPWNGRWFSGVPEMVDTANGLLRFDVGPNQTTYFRSDQSSALLRFVMHSSGTVELNVWLESRQSWNRIWYAPKDLCDSLSSCGPNGYCRQIITPQCVCLQGFHPRSPTNWRLRDGTGGCLRTTPLDCRNGTDGFVILRNIKLPDTSRSMVSASLSLDQCRSLCLNNCNCTAYAASNISDGSNGCITWTTSLTDITVYQSSVGQDLYVRLAAADLDSDTSSDRRQNHFVVIIVTLVVSIVVLSCLAFCLWRRMKKRGADIIEATEENDLDLPLFDLGTIRNATFNFSSQNKLGEGGFGPVYRGKIGEDQEIAVKRLSKTSTQGLNEFKNEVTLIAKLQHRNLVRLLGCCVQEEERILVYEYMPNGSLDILLFDEVKGTILDWRTRYNIIVGIARGLLYLHHDSRFRIIHRDLKASNILLDKDMDPKISDFGMARIFGGDESEANTRRVVGTYGYMSPEYIMDGIFSIKSDVFSFGVLVLEIISGKKNRGVYHGSHNSNLLGHIWNLWKESQCMDFVDKNIGHSFSEIEVLRCIKIGLLCVQDRAEDRPTMPLVLTMLSSTGDIALLPEPKQPGFFSKRDLMSEIYLSSSMSNHQDSSASNQITITNIEGR